MQVRKIVICVLGAACLASSCHHSQQARSLDLPAIMLWAWERPENLAFVDPQTTGIAFLAANAFVVPNGSVVFRMRTQALTLPPHIAVLPVVRIESPPVHAPVQAAFLFTGLQRVANLPGVSGIQLDFDARRSERAFYRSMLESLRKQTTKPITVTALESWCDGDRWLDSEPVVEAVPMFFRMGRGESRNTQLKSPLCRQSIGLSTDEPWPAKRAHDIKRIYLFSPRPWTREDYTRAMQRIEHWK